MLKKYLIFFKGIVWLWGEEKTHNLNETFQGVLTFCYFLVFYWICFDKVSLLTCFFLIPKCKSGQKKYQVNLQSDSAPIQVLLINRDLDSTVVFSVPPVHDICPTPPSTPASLQRFPLLSSASNTTSLYCGLDPVCSDQQMALPDLDDVLTPSCSPEDVEMGKSRGWWIEAKHCSWNSTI